MNDSKWCFEKQRFWCLKMILLTVAVPKTTNFRNKIQAEVLRKSNSLEKDIHLQKNMVAAITFVHLTVLFIQILLQLWHTMALQGYKCCEIDTVSLTYGSLQVLPWNNITTIEKMDSCDWWSEIIHFFQYIHFWNQRDIISNSDIFLLQLLFCKNTVDLKEYTATTVLL